MNCTNCGAALGSSARFCGACGTPVAETPPAAGPKATVPGTPSSDSNWWTQDEPTVPAKPTTAPAPAEAAPAPGRRAAAVADTASSATPGTTPRQRGERNWLRSLTFAVATFAIVVVAVFVVRALRGHDGAGSPQAAVGRVTSAVEHQDAVALLGAINPGEVHDLGHAYSQVRDRLSKEGAQRKHPTIESALFGLQNVHFSNAKFSVDRLSSTVAKVTLTNGTLDFDIAPTTADVHVPDIAGLTPSIGIGDAATTRTEHHSLTVRDLEYHVTSDDGGSRTVEPFLMTVRRGGGWYVSLTYSLAEEAVEAAGLPEPDFHSPNSPSSPPGASAPSDAIQGLAKAITDKNVAEGAAFLSGDEMQAVRDYAPAFQRLIDDNVPPEDTASIEINDLHTTNEGSGDSGLTRVDIDSASGSTRTSDDEGDTTDHTFNWNGECLQTDENRSCIADAFKRATGIKHVFVDMEHSRGRWTISPIATLLDYLNTAERSLPDAIVERLTSAYTTAPTLGTLATGSLVKGTLNDGGFAVYTLHGTKGETLSVDGSENDDDVMAFRLFDANGVELESPSELFTLPESGQYRLALVGDDYDAEPFQVRADVVVPQEASVPLAETTHLAADQTVAYEFDIAEHGDYKVRLISDGEEAGVDILDSSGEPQGCDNSSVSCTFSPGRYVVYLFGGSSAAEQTLSIDEIQVAFADGGTTEEGALNFDGDATSYTIDAPEGATVTLDLACDESVDCQLVVDGNVTDNNGDGGEESTTYETTGTTTDVDVRSYLGSGGFQLTVSSEGG